MHHEELDVLDVADQESFVSRRHHVACLLVGAKSNLQKNASANLFPNPQLQQASFSPQPNSSPAATAAAASVVVIYLQCCKDSKRTEGIVMLPLNRLLTRLSIPFGFLQLGSTRINRSF